MSTVSDWSYFTPEGERRDAREALATIDHADIRGLVTAFHLSVAGLPRSKLGDYPEGCPHNVLEDSPTSCPAHRVPIPVC
jgi:hypothetical protein